MAIANYTTKVGAAQSMSEIQTLLAKNGAQSVAVDYANGVPWAITFSVLVGGQSVSFRLSANAAGVLKAMLNDRTVEQRYRNEAQADRVAWRILKDWIRAQLAIIEAGIATLPQVMLPYAVTNTGATVFQRLEAEGPRALLQLTAGDTAQTP